jgi:hypothetical protein
MRMAREWMSRTYVKGMGVASGAVGGERERYAKHFYVVSVIACIILSGAALLLTDPGGVVWAFAVIWGIFFGVTFLFLMPGKILTTIFGALVGSGGSDLAGAAGVITESNKQLRELYFAVTGTYDGFSSSAIWLFVFVIAVLCLPAFFERASSTAAE